MATKEFPVFMSDKPTYYFDFNGGEISYLQHAQFIARFSISKMHLGVELWMYPMLDFRDMGTHYEVHCIITEYQMKPMTFEDFKKRTPDDMPNL